MQQELSKELSQGQGFAVSNGSFKEETSAAAWIIEGRDSQHCLNGQMYTPGQPNDHSSFQSKLAGILGVLHTLTFWAPHKPQVPFKLACNRLLVIMHLQTQQPINPSEPHVDHLTAAKNLLNSSSYQIKLVFIWGHQDTGVSMVLARDAWLNIEADELAKQKASVSFNGPAYYKLPGNPWGCYLGTQCIVNKFNSSICTFVNGQESLEY